MVFWESPDIWIEGPSGDPDVATPGETNKVKVHIWNLGLADCWAAHVDLYWCDPSVGIHPAVAQAIGSTVVTLAAGQHKVVEFDWEPTVVNNGHECLVAQVYDPVSDPVVAPFNPLQDRHCAQRNISVVPQSAGSDYEFDFFTGNRGWTGAVTEIELQKVEGDALRMVAMALGQTPWLMAGGRELQLSEPRSVELHEHPRAAELANGAFRETLQHSPGRNELRRVMGVLTSMSAVHGERRGEAGPDTVSAPPAEHRPQRTAGSLTELEFLPAATAGRLARTTVLRLPPGSRYRLTVSSRVPPRAMRGSADVFRIIERTAGQITGGITIVVRTS
jgi:hypothetical protein